MKFGKTMKSFVVGASIAAMVSPAMATNYDINIYGASAQFTFWQDTANDFLTNGGPACTSTTSSVSSDKKHGITIGTGCTGLVGGGTHTVTIRYSSKASYDGIEAVRGFDRWNSTACDTTAPYYSADYREMCDTVPCTSLTCQDVTIGASDVAGATFRQSSNGNLKGHLGGGTISRAFGTDATNTVYTDGLTADQPIVVPFGFFANNKVTKKICLEPTPDQHVTAHKAISKWGYECVPDGNGNSAECIGYFKCVGGVCSGGVNANAACTTATQCPDIALENTSCKAMPLDNISRPMAVLIYSGKIDNWSKFGPSFENRKIVACLRHAGSGTHATIDASIMNNSGLSLLTLQNISGLGGPVTWFNDGSSDMMKCINENGGKTDGTTLYGAIGYADSDQLADVNNNYPNVHSVKYEGQEPLRKNISNCEYTFWSAQWLFTDAVEINADPVIADIKSDLIAYASNPAKIPASKRDYWAAKDELRCKKTNDFSFPKP